MRGRTGPAVWMVAAVLSLAAGTLLTAWPSPVAAQTGGSRSFSDIEGQTHVEAIDQVHEAGIAEGCEEDRYCPAEPVTRGQMASFLASALELGAPSGEHFTDVADGDAHADTINALYEAGVTAGCTAERYCPAQPVTRAQMASFLANAFELSDSDTTYFTTGGPHRGSINAIADAGVTGGCRPLGLAYCPDQPVRRDQMATFLARSLELVPRVSIPTLLTRGDRGDDVTELQRVLRGLGYHLGDADGIYGNLTEHAVHAFQRVEGIAVDGIYGPQTRVALRDGPRSVMSSFTTPLQAGADRNANVHRGAENVHGEVIQAGERYSLNAGIGPRTSERGFVENGFIDGEGEIVHVVGGGVSQLATTMVNVAWFAGIELVDFRQHTIYFERYPMCREGTLVWDQLDVVLENDAPHPVTISSTYTDTGVTFTLVGDPWAEVASWTGEPFDIAGPDGAFSIRCGRTITTPDGQRDSEEYSWRYDEGYPG